MDANNHKLDTVLKERQQWVVPVYQRQYAWGRDLISQFWDDIQALSDNYIETGKVFPHFFGAIIYSNANTDGFGAIRLQHVVDGQQRLTTFHLFLSVLLDQARTRGLSRHEARLSEYLFNAESAAMDDPIRDKHKLWSSSQDRPHYMVLTDQGIEGLQEKYPHAFRKNGKVFLSDPNGPVPRMVRAFAILNEKVDAYISNESNSERESDNVSIERIFDGLMSALLMGLIIVVIELGKDDDARAIFASLNGRSKPLSAFDLIRNDIFQRAVAGKESDEELYDGAWKELEGSYWQEVVKQGRLKRARTDHFMAHMLAALKADDVSAAQVATEYKEWADHAAFPNVSEEIDSIIRFADIYKKLDKVESKQAEERIGRFLHTWDMSVFHPLVLAIGTSDASHAEKTDLYKRIEDYVVRRDLAGLTRKNFNKVVPSIIRHMQEHGITVSALDSWFEKTAGQASLMPSFAELLTGIREQDAYHILRAPKLRYIFHALEMDLRTGRQEKVLFTTEDLHVEHILPNKWAANWPLPSGIQSISEDWSIHAQYSDRAEPLTEIEIHQFTQREKLKNTLGNLTLLTKELNPSIGNAGWSIKRSKDGLGDSILMINRDILECEFWDEGVIGGRALNLAKAVDKVWPAAQSKEV